jgi:hypothetical protein
VYLDDYEIDARLHDLGVQRQWLVEAARQGDFQRRSTSPLEFPGAPAYKAASKGLEVLRRQSIEASGWHPIFYLGIPVTFNNPRTVAIAVTEGDENTGILTEDDPATKALKGPNTSRALDTNRLFDDAPVSFWYLLTFSDAEGLRAELSSPVLDEGGCVHGWDERVLLGQVDPGDGSTGRAVRPEPIPAPDIQPRRKSA